MKIKLKKLIFIIIIIFNFSIINWNFGSLAKDFNGKNNTSSKIDIISYPRSAVFNWGEIEVISEPIVGQNNNIKSSYEPKIAVENDKIYVVWADITNYNSAGEDSDIFFRYFDGSKWSKIQVISEPITYSNINTADSFSPDITVENGKIFVVWCDNNNSNGAGGDYEIFYRCNFTGTNWEDIQVISEPVKGKNFNTVDSRAPSIVVENDKIYICWSDNNNTNNAYLDYDIFYRCNLTGNGWEDIQVISEPVFGQNYNTGSSGYYDGPEIEVENSKIYIVWADSNNTNNADVDGDIFYRCNLTGSFWEPIQVISEPVHGQNFNSEASREPNIAVNNGNIYVVWSDHNNTNNASIDSDIFYRCNLTGNSWGDIQVISEPVFAQNYNNDWSGNPVITVEDDIIYVVWYDNFNTNYAGIDSDILYRYNFKNTCWEDIQVISEPVAGKNFNTESSFKPQIEVNKGSSHIVWQDNNLSNNAGLDSDIFYRSISLNFGLNSPLVTPLKGNTNTNFEFFITYFHLDNKNPTEMTVRIDGIKYLMSEVNPNDNNLMDGKDYFFNIKNLGIGEHTNQFFTSDGLKSISTKLYYEPIVYNSPPSIITENNLIAFEDVYYEVDYNYEDIDLPNVSQTGTWEFSTNADWLIFDISTAILNGTPTNDNVGEYWINISINDTTDIDFTNFTITVINVNDAPIIITNNTITINEDELYEINYNAIDVDTQQNNLNWFMITNATWLEFDQKSVTLSGLPINNNVGEFWVNISVNDGEYIDFSNFTLKVINVNDPPKIITNEIAIAYEDKYYEMDFKAEDIDNVQNDLTWTIKISAQWLRVDIKKSIINGTPLNDNVGEYWVNISVTDGEYTDDRNYKLIVKNINDLPRIIVKERTEVKVGELYSVQFRVNDIDPPPLIFYWAMETNTSDWLSIGPNTGLLIGEPYEDDIGKYWVNVSVNDGEDGWDYFNFTLEVLKGPEKDNDSSDQTSFSTETFYGIIWVIIIIIIVISVIILYTLQKQKKEVIKIIEKQRDEVVQTIKAELIQTIPSHITLPGKTEQITKEVLPVQPTIIDQLPEPEIEALPTTSVKSKEDFVKAVGTTPVPQQFQLPKDTLSKEQQLNLLRERFLKGEVNEEIYKKLKAEIDGSLNTDISDIEKELKE